MTPHALVTNDDGIDSLFLQRLVNALLPQFKVSVAAPTQEQSWMGRSMSRHGEVEVLRYDAAFPAGVKAWSVNGTPTDCVNIALGNLLQEKPDIVLSGINIGYNTTQTLILSSGTVAGAIEGTLWDLPAMAFSKCIPKEQFELISKSKGLVDPDLDSSLKAAAAHAARMALETLQDTSHLGCVINVNFPYQTSAQSEIVDTVPAKLRLGRLFAETSPGKFTFRYSDGIEIDPTAKTDRSALSSGRISRSILDFSRIGNPNEE
ncbi:MAG: 5'/3'-nucleotidase SurE [Verrucomicrobiota bacterium]|nr:5'/3'-nucleotidase SurE [Verrucomicrobiota bacterium]